MTQAGRCRKCYAALSPGAKFCPQCGEPVPEAAPAGVAGPQAAQQGAQGSSAASEDPWAPAGPAPRTYGYTGQQLCPRCHAPRQFGASQCQQCGMPFTGLGHTQGIPAEVEAQGRPAGFWIRLAAHIIDCVFATIGAVILSIIVGIAVGGVAVAGDEDAISGLAVAGNLLVLAAILAYYIVPVAHWGATPGKKLLNIYVLDAQGRKNIGYGRAIGRELSEFVSGFILCIGYIMAAFRDDKRALHDLMAGTYPTITAR